MHQREEMPRLVPEALARNVGLVEVSQKHRGERLDVADARAVVVPRGARGLVGLVQVIPAGLHAQLVHRPQQRGGVARNVAALAAALVVPELHGRDLLVPAEQRLHHPRLVGVGDAVDDDLALLLQLPHVLAHVVHTLAEVELAPVDALLDPFGRLFCIRRRQVSRLEELSVPRNAAHSPSSCSSSISSYSSRFSSMKSSMTSNRFSSIVSSCFSTPVISQIVYISTDVLSGTSHAVSVVCSVFIGIAFLSVFRSPSTFWMLGPQSGK